MNWLSILTEPHPLDQLISQIQKNRDLLEHLTLRLAIFFGDYVGCDDPSFPKFHATGNFRRIHQRMRLTNTEFDNFNLLLKGILSKKYGFKTADVETVCKVLDEFQTKVVYQRRVPAASVTGFPPLPSQAAKTAKKTTAKKTTAKKTTAKKTTAKKTTAKKTTAKKTTAKKTTAKKTTAKKTTAKKTTAKKTTAKKTAKKTTAKKTA